MNYVNLGRTGVKVSPLCLGTMNFGPRTPEDEAKKIIDASIEAGINFIDTANLYGQPLKDGRGQGISEEIIGRALKANGKRDFVVLATKFTSINANYPEDPNSSGASRRHIMQEVEGSLRRLKTDYIDLYQLHTMTRTPLDETLRALDDLVRDGKVRYIGTSNHFAWRIMEGLGISEQLNLAQFVSEQPPYSMVHRIPEFELFPMAEKYNIALLPWSPLWGGWLTGKYRRDAEKPQDGRFEYANWKGIWDEAPDPRVWDLIDLLDDMANEKGCTISQLALAWVLAQPAVTAPIIGPRTLAQLEDNLGALDVKITDEDKAKIDKIAKPRTKLVGIRGGDA